MQIKAVIPETGPAPIRLIEGELTGFSDLLSMIIQLGTSPQRHGKDFLFNTGQECRAKSLSFLPDLDNDNVVCAEWVTLVGQQNLGTAVAPAAKTDFVKYQFPEVSDKGGETKVSPVPVTPTYNDGSLPYMQEIPDKLSTIEVQPLQKANLLTYAAIPGEEQALPESPEENNYPRVYPAKRVEKPEEQEEVDYENYLSTGMKTREVPVQVGQMPAKRTEPEQEAAQEIIQPKIRQPDRCSSALRPKRGINTGQDPKKAVVMAMQIESSTLQNITVVESREPEILETVSAGPHKISEKPAEVPLALEAQTVRSNTSLRGHLKSQPTNDAINQPAIPGITKSPAKAISLETKASPIVASVGKSETGDKAPEEAIITYSNINAKPETCSKSFDSLDKSFGQARNSINLDDKTSPRLNEAESMKMASTEIEFSQPSNPIPQFATVFITETELEQIPAFVYRQLETGKGERQIIFKLNPPELGEVMVRVREQADKGLEARVVVGENIPQVQVDALVAKFADINRPGVNLKIEVAATLGFTAGKEEGTSTKKERERQEARRNERYVNHSSVFYG